MANKVEESEPSTKKRKIQQEVAWWKAALRQQLAQAVLANTGLTEPHITAYDELVSVWLKDIVLTSGKIDLLVDKCKYKTVLTNYRFIGSGVSPHKAHTNNLSYNGTIYVDIAETVQSETAVVRRLVKNVPICKFPVMLLSTACNLNAQYDITKQIEPELGGSFVVRGKRRYIPMVKGLMNNYPYKMWNSAKNQKHIQVRSNHLHSLHRSTSTLEMFLDVDKLTKVGPFLKTLKIRIPFLVTPVPLWVIITALGWKVDEFLTATAAYLGHSLPLTTWTQYALLLRCTWSDQSREQALAFLNHLYSKPPEDNTALVILTNEILPHLNGSFADSKCWYLAYMLGLLLLFEENLVPESDKDSMLHSRVVTSGQSLAALFRILYLSFIRQGHKIIRRNVKQQKPIEIMKIYKESRLTQRLLSAVATGIWSAKRKGVSHQLVTGNNQSVIGQMRRISSSVLNSDGKHILPRMIQADSYGYICAAETQEGEGCGLVSALACTARIATGTDNKVVTAIYTAQLGANFLALPVAGHLIAAHWYKLFDSFGVMLGFVLDISQAVTTFQQLRRDSMLDCFTTYFRDDVTRDLRLECGAGRLLRPLLVVANMAKIPAVLAAPGFAPNLLKVLILEGCIEYVSPAEERYLAVSKNFADVFHQHATHLEITDVSFVGVTAALAPFFRFNQGPRLAYWIGMCKQIVACTSNQDQGAVTVNNLWYGQKPIVNTLTAQMLDSDQEATGVNCNVIFFPLSYNQEDAIIMNKASVERGMFVSDLFKLYEANRVVSDNRKYDERFEKPNPQDTTGLKLGKYDHLTPPGLPALGSHLQPMDVIIGKTIPMKLFSPLAVVNGPKNFRHPEHQKKRKDMSLQLNIGEEGVVHKTQTCRLPNAEIAKVVLRTTKIPEVGDKFSSRHSQKGTIGRLENPENLPFSMKTGMVPDIVMSPLGFPSRMTMGKLLEILMGKAVCVSGQAALDDQNFEGTGDEIIQKIGRVLSAHGFHSSGKEVFCDGATGEMIEAHVMSGIVAYSKLNHMVSRKMHARSTGPRHILTHQPNEGRSSNGGLRFGPMEVDCAVAHSATEVLRERIMTVSDECQLYICQLCGFIADGNKDLGFFFCRHCRTGAHIKTVPMSYTTKLMMQELNATGIKIKLQVK